MSLQVWEELISLNAYGEYAFERLGCASEYQSSDSSDIDWNTECRSLDEALRRDTGALPTTKDREGYYGKNHFSYWASGLRDLDNLEACAGRLGVDVNSYLDFGCATGRVIRHSLLRSPERQTMGCDINRKHVDWCSNHLPESAIVFQNHSIPTLPLPDNSVDLVSAFSVFTHIEAFETSWLMELRRILRPGGIAWLTIHSEKTFEEVDEGWPLYTALRNHGEFQSYKDHRVMDKDRLVFRWKSDRSYSSNVFYTMSYIKRTWGRILPIVEVHRRLPAYQDVVVLQKK